MKLTYRFVFSLLLFFSITAVFSQNLSDQEIGFDAARITTALKKRGMKDQNIQEEIAIMRKIHNEQYVAMKKREDEILQKITSEQTLKTETNKTANTGLTAKTANTLVTDIPQTEKDALLALYNSTNGSNWTNKTGWNFSTPVTSGWYGITVTEGHVTGINLSNNKLSGTIPAEIGQLTQLQSLWLNNNQLSGTIPASIGLLTQLQTLSLSTNQLSGTIPVEIGQLTKLTSLSLNQNQFSGTIPVEIGQLTQLTSIYLNNNQLSGTIPDEIGLLTKLIALYLGNNKLSGTIPASIGQLTQLQILSLVTNKLSGTIPAEIGQLAQLNTLYLNDNQLSGTIPVAIGQLTQLQILFLNNNQLTGAIPASIGLLTKLTSLLLYSNQLNGSIPTSIGQLTQLQILYLQQNQLSGPIPATIGQLIKVTNISLSVNQLSGPIPAEIGQLAQLQNLYSSSNQLSGTIPTSIGQLTKLENLYLNDNQLSGSIPAEIGLLIRLTSLQLYDNQLNGTIPATIGQLTLLQTLLLIQNQLEGKIPNLTNVKSNLNFQYNKFRFVDFASEYDAYKSKLSLFSYSNQAKTDSEKTITKTVGETQTLTMYEDNRFTPTDTYQWYKNGQIISGATSREYTLSNLTLANAGDYYCISKNPQMTITTVANQNLTLTRNTIHLNIANCSSVLSSAAGTNIQTNCISTAITPITYTSAGLITNATFSGLPSGITGNFISNTITISGNPTVAGNFPYTITYIGNCGSTVTSTGTIIVIANNTITLSSPTGTDNQSKNVNTIITPVTYSTTGATEARITGLPTGVTGTFASNMVTISGTPTVSGIFNFLITLAGGCGTTNTTGKITTLCEPITGMIKIIQPVTYSSTKSGSFSKNNCAVGKIGSVVNFSANATSNISQADADLKAQTAVNAGGQAYANTNGACTTATSTFYYQGQWENADTIHKPEINCWVKYLDENGVEDTFFVGGSDNGCQQLIAASIVQPNNVRVCTP